MEEWKDLIYQNKIYDFLEVSNNGKIRNKRNGHIYKLHPNTNGYLTVNISLGSRKHNKTFLVHKAVAESFIPNLENKPQVNHKDLNKTNNIVSNLEWVTNQENCIHAQKLLHYGQAPE